jgi:hypothetical protein
MMAFWKRLFGRSATGTGGPHSAEMERILAGLRGEPGSGEARLRVALCERAFQILDKDDDPRLWAFLGDNPPDNVERAISLCRDVLAFVPPAAMPREWGSAQMALGHALTNRAGGDHAENVEQAIVCYEAALTVRSEEWNTGSPLHWHRQADRRICNRWPSPSNAAGGMLSLLPLHAAWCFDEQATAKRRYVMDSLTFRYAPNARSFLAAQRTAARIKLDKVLAVANPSPTKRRNPFTQGRSGVGRRCALFRRVPVAAQ